MTGGYYWFPPFIHEIGAVCVYRTEDKEPMYAQKNAIEKNRPILVTNRINQSRSKIFGKFSDLYVKYFC